MARLRIRTLKPSPRVFALPVPPEELTGIQLGSSTHWERRVLNGAVDLIVPAGTAVTMPVEGTVLVAQGSFGEGGNDSSHRDEVNMISFITPSDPDSVTLFAGR